MGFYVVAAIGLGLLIAAHEAGHLLFARLMGMRVETFSLGFGPRIAGFRRGETDYRISAFPLGGYCKIAGFTSEEEAAQDPNDAGSYLNKAPWRRFLVIAAGPLTNYAVAFLLLLAVFLFRGMPAVSSRIEVVPGGPAATAGLQTGDEVVAVDGVPVKSFEDLRRELAARQAPERRIAVLRNGERIETAVRLRDGRIQVQPLPRFERASPGAAFGGAARVLWNMTTGTLAAIGDLFRRRTLEGLSGPLDIVRQASASVRRGATDFVVVLATISVGLAVFNFAPVPALDGGRLVFLGVELVTGRRVNQRIEEALHVVGVLALLALVAYVVLFGDLQLGKRIFSR